MKYRFTLSYKSTDSDEEVTRQVSPLYGDDPNTSIERVSDEWYYTRKLNGKFTFVRGDYSWIMARPFDGTYTMTVECSTDGGSWQEYFKGTFSRANLTIDEDNQNAVLDGLSEGTYNVIENARGEEYDLRKLIPDSEARTVQGKIPPALALVDYRSPSITTSDIFCGGASVGNGYIDGKNDWDEYINAGSTLRWNLIKVCGEANVEMTSGQSTEAAGKYCGYLEYHLIQPASGGQVVSVEGTLWNENGCQMYISVAPTTNNILIASMDIYGSDRVQIVGGTISLGNNSTGYCTPSSLVYTAFGSTPFEKVDIRIHYIRVSLLTFGIPVGVLFPLTNVLNVGPYYKGMQSFNNQDGGLVIEMTTRTTESPNGHRMVPGSDGIYFAPPDDEQAWHPVAEDNWNFASMWYTIQPSVANGLLDTTKVGVSNWSRCWTVGTCLRYLLDKITSGKVVFEENEFYSQFLYSDINPVAQGEQFSWLVCQKSDVMSPNGTGSTRCIVTLNWFLELLRNAFNCYWWLQPRNDGRYDFRIEHVEYFRRGSSYADTLDDPTRGLIDITKIKPLRNFLRRGEAAKRLSDQTNRYTFDLNGMAEKYTFAWQGDGGSDEFKGHPMLFKAGWIEEGTSESHEVDNIFADLNWLTLNAGTDTASSKNYDGLFIFSGYMKAEGIAWDENSRPPMRYPQLASGIHIVAFMDIWLTAPAGQVVSVTLRNTDTMTDEIIASITGTGSPQVLSLMVDEMRIGGSWVLFVDFGANWQQVTIHRVHGHSGTLYLVPSTESRLHPGEEVYLQNGPLAWPSLQCEYLHYDVPAAKWAYDSDDALTATFQGGGTVKLIKKQDVSTLPVSDLATEQRLKEGIRTGLGTGILDTATVNLGSRNAEMTLVYDITPLV